MSRTASVKETGEEVSPAEWERFEAAVQDEARQRDRNESRRDATLGDRRVETHGGPERDGIGRNSR